MDNLPLELYFEILNYCDLIDLFTVRLINKKFKQIVNYYGPKELIFYKYSQLFSGADRNSTDVWFGSNRSINIGSLIDNSKLRLLNGSLFDVQKLRKLKITVEYDDQINYKIISSLNMLESLMIDIDGIDRSKSKPKKQKLSIDSLKNFKLSTSFFKFSYDDCALVIDCPNLESLNLDCDLRHIEIINSSSIKYLSIYSVIHLKNLSTFKNLEHLYYQYETNQLPIDVLDILPKLKIIQIDTFVNNANSNNWRLLDLISKQKNQNVNQNSRDLKIYYKSVQVNNQIELNDFMNGSLYGFNFRLRNYHRLMHPLIDVRAIHYNDIIQINLTKPVDFHSKFSNIQTIYLTNTPMCDEQIASEFISNCESLRQLIIEDCKISQTFLDQLGSISKLTTLKLKQNKIYGLDFKFINKMRYLQNLITNQQIRTYSELSLNDLSYLKCFEFKISQLRIRIKKHGHDNYNIEVNKKFGISEKEQFDLSSLIEQLNNLKDEILNTNASKRKAKQTNSSKRLKVDHKQNASDTDIMKFILFLNRYSGRE